MAKEERKWIRFSTSTPKSTLPTQHKPREVEQGCDTKLLNTKQALFLALVRKILSCRAAIVHVLRETVYKKKGWGFLGREVEKKRAQTLHWESHTDELVNI